MATDDVNTAVEAACSPASGTSFPLGVTTVECKAADAAGNVATKSFTVTVNDTTAPRITTSEDLVAEATSAAGAEVSFEAATATDTVDPEVGASCSPASGTAFELGTTTVECAAKDAAGNSATKSFTVTVKDTTAPTVKIPADLNVDATGAAGATVTYAVSAHDAVDGAVSVACTPRPSGDVFPIGATTVTCTATDAAGNTSAAASFVVTVNGATAQIHQLIDKTVSHLRLPATSAATLTSGLRSVADALVARNPRAACLALTAFKSLVTAASRAGRIPAADAQDLIARADRIRAVLGC
jgi:HYR domain